MGPVTGPATGRAVPARPAGGRVLAEHALRAAALAALGVALWQRLGDAPPPTAVAAVRADEAGLTRALGRWTAAATPAADVRLDTVPGPAARAWLAALAAAGTRVTWRAARAPALAAAVEPVADPAGGLRLLAAAPAGSPVRASDALGPLDSARVDGGPVTSPGPAPGGRSTGNVSAAAGTILGLPDVAGLVRVGTDGATARVRTPASRPRLGTVLVVGRAAWEGRFTAAALEERGWTVRTRFAVAPGVVVGDAAVRTTAPPAAAPGAPAAPAAPRTRPAAPRLDTSTVAAVVALDSTAAALGPALVRYVRAGGGLVLAGDAARAPALAALAPAAPGAVVDDSAGAVAPLTRPRADAVPLAWRRVGGGRVLVAAARRVGAGRVVQLADVESWRRRLDPAADAAAAHRAWWAQAVAAAAYAPAPPDASPPPAPGVAPADSLADPAPLAATVAALGPTAAVAAAAGEPTTPGAPRPRRVPDTVLIPAALAALLAEVASRRLRGAA